MSPIHSVFHMSSPRKYVHDLSHVLEYEVIKVQDYLLYEERPVWILNRNEQILRSNKVALVKVLWKNYLIREAT